MRGDVVPAQVARGLEAVLDHVLEIYRNARGVSVRRVTGKRGGWVKRGVPLSSFRCLFSALSSCCEKMPNIVSLLGNTVERSYPTVQLNQR